ncbi:XRE family transcriptional regulator [Desulfocurvus sp.]|jgi:quercetin dioxygenase-like cupin family protein/DNA-binding XRE family transcriptional regulator|uniref:helix-turn-helix domain-containing protein n=1 Tax=Desulfocurvus sp. TaxID=2871698 RepID=UPI0025B869DD|nr:XRE family transcriptional regulator [Desulfocurvus sp.]MCK9241404.1 XRE family transcriptional regulator [Desulfocurvus sp.]
MEKAYKEIAPRLSGLRDALGLSVDQMARRLGVEPEKVAAYESGDVEIPVSYLFTVAQECGIDLTVLVSGGEAHLRQYSLVRKGEGLAVERRKDYDYKSLAYRFTGRRMEPFLIRVPPKAPEQVNTAAHAGQEFIYMLEGRLEITLAGRPEILEPGDSLYFNSETPHGLRALGDSDALFLDVIL